MKTIKKNVYYCDFCKKRSLRSLKIHEKHCTANPDRECRICEYDNIHLKEIVEKYRAMFTLVNANFGGPYSPDSGNDPAVEYSGKFTWREIAEDFEQCPACTLAVLRQLGMLKYWHGSVHEGYDMKAHFKEWWDEKHAADEMANERYY